MLVSSEELACFSAMTSIQYFVYHIVVVRFSPEKKKDHNNLVLRTFKTQRRGSGN